MEETDILIIGAGASGLLVARELLRAGKSVRILEARDRIGGRIHTIYEPAFPHAVEMGAEFVHGKLPITLGLLKEYGLKHKPLEGRMFYAKDGKISAEQDQIPGAKELNEALENLQQDMTVQEFLDLYLGDPAHRELYGNVQRFVEGYDAADIDRASALAFKKEWHDSEPEEQSRPVGGYHPLVEELWNECRALGGRLSLSSVAKRVQWERNRVEITTSREEKFTANKVLVTVPLGVWLCRPEDEAYIDFVPGIPEKAALAAKLGYGSVVKIVLRFSDAFWNHSEHQGLKNRMGFLFSETGIPTWWTQETGDVPMLTGWLGGPTADALRGVPDEMILHEAVVTLAQVFGKAKAAIHDMIQSHYISRWTEDPFALGAYSYAVVNGELYKKLLSQPIENTLFFAGEALDEGGTVEAALASGMKVAGLMG
jgi:monoamine oxidase